MEPVGKASMTPKRRVLSGPHRKLSSAVRSLPRPRCSPCSGPRGSLVRAHLAGARSQAGMGLVRGWDAVGARGPGAAPFPGSPFLLGAERQCAAWSKRQPFRPRLLILASVSRTDRQTTSHRLGLPEGQRRSGSVGCAEWQGGKGLASQAVRPPSAPTPAPRPSCPAPWP